MKSKNNNNEQLEIGKGVYSSNHIEVCEFLNKVWTNRIRK